MVQIVQLDTSRARDARRFVRFVFDLYRDSPYWVPPVYGDALKQVSPRHNPYFEHSEAAFFLAMQGFAYIPVIFFITRRKIPFLGP